MLSMMVPDQLLPECLRSASKEIQIEREELLLCILSLSVMFLEMIMLNIFHD